MPRRYMPRDPATILDIVLACLRVEKFLLGSSESEFQIDDEKQWAVVSQLILIGEAVRRLSDEFRSTFLPFPGQNTQECEIG
jgi:uncharacterized protein with HEPN domain